MRPDMRYQWKMELAEFCSNSDIGQGRIPEESPDGLRELLEAFQRTSGDFEQFGPALDAPALDIIVFDVLPHPFVWLELKGITGKKEQLQPTPKGSDVVLDDWGFMEGNVIEHKEDRSGRIMHELGEKLHEHGAVATADEHVELERTTRRDRGDHVDRRALPGDRHHRRLSHRRPGGARVMIGAHPRLVAEVHLRTFPASLRPDRRELLLFPPPDRRRVLLVGAVQRPLRRQPEPVQQLPHALWGHLDTEPLTNEVANDFPGPPGEVELELPRVTTDQPSTQLTGLLISQFRRSPGKRANLQSVQPTRLIRLLPREVRGATQLQRHHDGLRRHIRIYHSRELTTNLGEFRTRDTTLLHKKTLSELAEVR